VKREHSKRMFLLCHWYELRGNRESYTTRWSLLLIMTSCGCYCSQWRAQQRTHGRRLWSRARTYKSVCLRTSSLESAHVFANRCLLSSLCFSPPSPSPFFTPHPPSPPHVFTTMKLTFKDLQQKRFTIDVEPSDKVQYFSSV